MLKQVEASWSKLKDRLSILQKGAAGVKCFSFGIAGASETEHFGESCIRTRIDD